MLELDEWIPENCDSVTKAVTNILAKAPQKSLSQNLDDVFDEYHNAVCSIESSGNAFLDTLMGAGIGAMDTVVGLGEGTKHIVEHPLETALGLAMLMQPIYRQQFLYQATQQFKNFSQEDIIDGDPLTRSKGISRVLCEIGLLAAPFLKASGVSKCAEGAKVAETAGEVAKGAEVIKDIELANEAKNVAKGSGGYKIDLQRFGRGAEEAGVAGGAKGAGLKACLSEEAAKSVDVVGEASKYWKNAVEHNGVKVYQRNDIFDPNLIDDYGRTNLQRMQKGKAPIGIDGKPVNLHHMLQTNDSAIAEVTQSFHQVNKKTIHINPNTMPSGIDRNAFDAWKKSYWRTRANDFK